MKEYRRFRATSTRYSRKLLKLAICTGICASFAACTVAPGMRMQERSAIPAGRQGPNGTESQLTFPTIPIDLNLIREMQESSAQQNVAMTQALFEKPGPYHLGVGDVLQITVWDHPELNAALGAQPQQSQSRPADPSSGFIIDATGAVQFPYIGSVRAKGMTVDEFRASLNDALAKAFNKPQVTVRVASYRSQQIYVDGEVKTPGPESINDIPMTLYEAIGRAGGFSTTADQSHLVLVRNSSRYQIDLAQMIDKGVNPADVYLRNGDLLRVVPRDENGVFVMGEVNKPTTAVPMKTGLLSLSDAISQAGSINTASADAAKIFVIRNPEGSDVKIYQLEAQSPVAMLLANDFKLKPKDIVYVDGNGLVRFSRVLQLLIPGINAALTGAIVAK